MERVASVYVRERCRANVADGYRRVNALAKKKVAGGDCPIDGNEFVTEIVPGGNNEEVRQIAAKVSACATCGLKPNKFSIEIYPSSTSDKVPFID